MSEPRVARNATLFGDLPTASFSARMTRCADYWVSKRVQLLDRLRPGGGAGGAGVRAGPGGFDGVALMKKMYDDFFSLQPLPTCWEPYQVEVFDRMCNVLVKEILGGDADRCLEDVMNEHRWKSVESELLVVAPRGSGKTNLMQKAAATFFVNIPGFSCCVYAGTKNKGQDVYNGIVHWIKTLVRRMDQSRRPTSFDATKDLTTATFGAADDGDFRWMRPFSTIGIVSRAVLIFLFFFGGWSPPPSSSSVFILLLLSLSLLLFCPRRPPGMDEGATARRKRTAHEMEERGDEDEGVERAATAEAKARRRRAAPAAVSERDAELHMQHVLETTPSLAPDRRPLLVGLDPDRLTPMMARTRSLGEITFGCDGHVPFRESDADPSPEDHLFLEQLNYRCWLYRDACTAIVVGHGSGVGDAGPAAFLARWQSFALLRGGKPFPASRPDVLLALPAWDRNPLRGTLSASPALRSVELALTADEAARSLAPAGRPAKRRDDDFYDRYVDLRIFVRFADCAPGARVRAALAPAPSPATSDADRAADADGAPTAPLAIVAPCVDVSAFAAALEAEREQPATWYCVAVSDPEMLCTTDEDYLVRALMAAVPRAPPPPPPSSTEEDFLTEGYPAQPAAPRDESSRTTAGMIRDIDANGALDGRDCDAWIAERGDGGLLDMARALLMRPQQPSSRALAALAELRLVRRECRRAETEDEAAGADADALGAFRLLRAASSLGSLASDLAHFVFWTMTKRYINRAFFCR